MLNMDDHDRTSPPVRRADAIIEPLNDLTTSDSDYRRVSQAGSPDREGLSLRRPEVRDQPSHEDVARLEAEKERLRLSNEAKDMVFDAIYVQVPSEIQCMLDRSMSPKKAANPRLEISKLSNAELKRLAKWLIEEKPFEDIKESEPHCVPEFEDSPTSIEEENDNATDGLPVFPHGHVPPMQASLETQQQSSKGKKTVERTDSVLGEGTYGKVRVAKYKGQCYAAKELKIHDTHYMDNLYREATNLALLEDDNIVSFCGIGVYKGQCNGSFLILTELLATSLHRYLMEDPTFVLQNGISILSDVLSGLDYMHQEPCIIHGDLKTKNVLLSKDGIAKIADLGSSLLANDDAVHGRTVQGTPTYMAPEMACQVYTEKIDVFAYGHLSLVTLTRWEIGLPQFSKPQNNTDREICKRIKLFDKLEHPKLNVVRDFIPLVKQCLRDESNQRTALSQLKCEMQSLSLPQMLPTVSLDTAVRNEV